MPRHQHHPFRRIQKRNLLLERPAKICIRRDQFPCAQQRIDNLTEVKGLMKFVVLGERGFELLTHFGTDPIPDEPATSITVDEEAYRDLRSGALNPQDAFMNGRISIEGDMQMAMQLALAAISPD